SWSLTRRPIVRVRLLPRLWRRRWRRYRRRSARHRQDVRRGCRTDRRKSRWAQRLLRRDSHHKGNRRQGDGGAQSDSTNGVLFHSPPHIIRNAGNQSRENTESRGASSLAITVVLELPQIRCDLFAAAIAHLGRQASRVDARPPADERRGQREPKAAHAFTSRRGRRATVLALALDSCLALTAAASPAAVNV